MDLLNAIGCFYWFWHWQAGELPWGKLGPSSMTVENFWEGSRRRVQELSLRLCVCVGSVPLPFWLEFYRCSWMILPQACKWSSPIRDILGFGVSVTRGSDRYPQYDWHCWAWKMGWHIGWENPQPESLAVGLRWRGWVGVGRSLSNPCSHEDKHYSGV